MEKNHFFKDKKKLIAYAISFLLLLVLTIFVNIVYLKYVGKNSSGTKIYVLNLKKLTDLKRQELHQEIFKHPSKINPQAIKAQITSYVKDVNLDADKYESSGVIIVKQAIIGGKGYQDITGKIEQKLKAQGVL